MLCFLQLISFAVVVTVELGHSASVVSSALAGRTNQHAWTRARLSLQLELELSLLLKEHAASSCRK